MYNLNHGQPTPTATIAINKSRLKVYGKKSEVPTYYLQKGQEFQIELFNPTKDTILAKISLNGKPIAQGGLVLKPAQRVFLDRYIDVARKFKFDTYEVANTSESRKAIEDNGDFKVQFYREVVPQPTIDLQPKIWHDGGNWGRGLTGNVNTTTYYNNSDVYGANSSLGLTSLSDSTYTTNSAIGTTTTNNVNLDSLDMPLKGVLRSKKSLRGAEKKSKKSVETGRVEKGSHSDQTLTTVYMDWESYPFHTIEYKMLPISQKVNTVADVSVKRYCTHCGSKQKPNFKFCPSCGTRV